MSKASDFVSVGDGGLPAMPRNAGSSPRRNANSAPAESRTTPGDYNSGIAYRFPNQVRCAGVSSPGFEFKFFLPGESESWSVDPHTVLTSVNALYDLDDYLGVTMNTSEELVIVPVDNGQSPRPVPVFAVLDKVTGAAATTVSTKDGGSGSAPYWPGNAATAGNIRIAGTDFDINDGNPVSDQTRTFLDVDKATDNYIVIGQSALGGLVDSVAERRSSIVVVDHTDGSIISRATLMHEDGVTPVNHPILYRTADGKVLIGQIFSRYHPTTRQFLGRFATFIRGDSEKVVRIPDDPGKFFSINRYQENPQVGGQFWYPDRGSPTIGAVGNSITTGSAVLAGQGESNHWFPNQSNFVDGTYDAAEQGYRACPEPIKILALNDRLAILACPMPNSQSITGNTFIEGCTFPLRADFDTWAHAVCDHQVIGVTS